MNAMNDRVCYTHLTSPLGKLLLLSDGEKLTGIQFPGHQPKTLPAHWKRDAAPFGEVVSQLRAYFAGELSDFDLPLAMQGSPFERKVWSALCKIPYGKTVSYGHIASKIGQPKACRAVGLANGKNPIPIIVPCHRVIGANGSLTGYGGGLDLKRKLLRLEGVELETRRQQTFLAAI
jgi:methylated-DNA-[protein]-cysteine S-methyltransferase